MGRSHCLNKRTTTENPAWSGVRAKQPAIAPISCCSNLTREEIRDISARCSAYLDQINLVIARLNEWPQAKTWTGIQEQLATCLKAERYVYADLRAELRSNENKAGTSLIRRHYLELAADFQNQRWDNVISKIANGYPLALTPNTGEPGYDRNAFQLAALYGAPELVLEKISESGVEIPDYSVPLALTNGNVSTYQYLRSHVKNLNTLLPNGKPAWSSSMISNDGNEIGKRLLADGADFSLVYELDGYTGNVLAHYLIDRQTDASPNYSIEHIQAMVDGGASVSLDMLDLVSDRKVRELLLSRIETCAS